MAEQVSAERVRAMLACIEQELTAAVRSPGFRGSRLVRLRVLLAAAQAADLPMDDVCRQVCAALRDAPPLLR